MTLAAGLEIELKLEPDGGAPGAILAVPDLADVRFDARAQPSTYFDTKDRALHAAGMTLRVRRIGDRHVQTVKAVGASAGLFARSEWERDIADAQPVIDASAGPLMTLLPDAALAAIRPVFTIDVTRQTGIWREDATEIEIVLDTGEIVAGDRRAAIAEIELELKAGAPAALFALARALAETQPLRIGVLSKSDRGYRLLDDVDVNAAVKRARVTLRAAATPAEAFQAIVAACLRQYRLNEVIVLRRQTPEALHQARVALRRLRSAFSIFARVVADPRADALRAELRWLAGALGRARDLDVLIAADPGPDAERLHAARAEAYAGVLAALRSGRAMRLMLDLVEWVTSGEGLAGTKGVPRTAERFAADVLERLRAKLKRRGRKIGKRTDEARHEIRILAKKLRYATKFCASLFPGRKAKRRLKAFLRALAALQAHLGELNDIATGPAVRMRLGIAPVAEVAGRRRFLLGAAEDAHAALIDAKRFW